MKFADDTRMRVPAPSKLRESAEVALIVVLFWGFYAFDCAADLLRRP